MACRNGESWFKRNSFWFVPIMVALVCIATAICVPFACSWTSAESLVKTVKSDIAGIDRTVTLYSYDGEEIDRWEGTMRIENDDPGETSFIIDGKRTIIEGGIVVVEER